MGIFLMFYLSCQVFESETSGCFGTGSSDDDFLRPECLAGDIIIIKELYAGSKYTSLNCPSESTDTDRNHARCCTPSVNDCLAEVSVQSVDVYRDCTGRSKCKLRVDRVAIRRPCSYLVYMTVTHYMYMTYSCIPAADSELSLQVRCGNQSTTEVPPSYICSTLGSPSTLLETKPLLPASAPSRIATEDTVMHPGTIAALVVVGICLIAVIFLIIACILKTRHDKKYPKSKTNSTVSYHSEKTGGTDYSGFLWFKTGNDTSWATRTQDPSKYPDEDEKVDLHDYPYQVYPKTLPPKKVPGSSSSRGTRTWSKNRPFGNQTAPLTTKVPTYPSIM